MESERKQNALDAIGVPPLWEHLLKAYAYASLPYLSNFYHTSTTRQQFGA